LDRSVARPSTDRRPDLPARALEVALALLVIAAPLPFGAVPAAGRLALELAGAVLLVAWLARSWFHSTPLPSRPVLAGFAGLLGLAIVHVLPLGVGAVGLVSPAAASMRAASRPPAAVLEAERRMLGRDPVSLDEAATLSLDPGGTASALRTGGALVAVFLVAATVVGTCGARRLALALLGGAAFQGLYGLLVMASNHDRIWHLPKVHFLDTATGTFVNPNHFACLLAMSLPCGLALVYDRTRRHGAGGGTARWAAWLSTDGSRNWLLGLLLVIGAAGLLLSHSRAGIVLGGLALGLTLLGAGRHQGLRTRAVVALLVFAAAIMPLAQLGTERLVDRFAAAPEELHGARVRVWVDTLSLVAGHPVVGCGFGAFAASYPLVRSPEIRSFFAHAHNDPLQLLAEGGTLGLACLLLVVAPTLRLTVRALAGDLGTLAVGFAAGLTAMLLHGLVDFNFHIPSNAAISAVLGGALWGLAWRHPL
jgi:O-antigen ligase